MIGRKKRNRVVFIDGIPIESGILDAGETGIKKDDQVDPAALTQLDPRALFEKYDTDGSGAIDLEEFKVLLHDLNITLSEPKMLAYFKRCDQRHRGEISFEEFRLALYTCDPKNPNRTMGFAPGQSLTPKDLFDMFDREEQGAIDRATFLEILAFLGKSLPLDRVEGIFQEHEDRETEMMPYYQFKKAWISIIDVRAELRARHEKFNSLLPVSVLSKRLEAIVNDEEKQEAKMLLEAASTLKEEQIARQRRWIIDESVLLSQMVLADAIDAAGQVYVFGEGAFHRFESEPQEPDFVDFMEYDIVKELWSARVHPEKQDNQSPETTNSNSSSKQPSELPSQASRESGQPLSRTQIALHASRIAFSERRIALVTALLWGKRVCHVSCGAAVAYALTDAGEVFCWGGNQRKWRYFYDDATLPAENAPVDGNGEADQQAKPERPLTVRSEMLKQVQPLQVQHERKRHDQMPLRVQYSKTFVKPERALPTDEEKYAKLKLIAQYYDLIPADAPEPAPETATSAPPPSTDALPVAPPPSLIPTTLQGMMETIEPELNVDDLVLALNLRGVYLAKQTRMELIDKLGDCLALELECLGPKFHAHMKEEDHLARRCKQDRQAKRLEKIEVRCSVLWNELRLLQERLVQAENEVFSKMQLDYAEMKKKIAVARQRIKRQAREGRSTRDSKELRVPLNGLTSRGAPSRFFDGAYALQDIAVGSRHALAIHQTGKLYGWGVGSFGRLGGIRKDPLSGCSGKDNKTSIDAWHRDIHSPQVVPSLETTCFRAVCCGFSHSLALASDGAVYVWGSATHGKLGIGASPQPNQESFTLAPVQLALPDPTLRVRKIACGPSHSAVLTIDGSLFVWGSGDGGKLGLGDGREIGEDCIPRNGGMLRVVEIPRRVAVDALAGRQVVDVSCGRGHTVIATTDGQVFAAGSSHALGAFSPTFAPVSFDSSANKDIFITRVSCGDAHTALVSRDGELLTWGNNHGGATGHPLATTFLKTPTRVSCLYRPLRDLCKQDGVSAMQSSQNASCSADRALRLNPAQSRLECAQTQQEFCAFWQASLPTLSRIERIRVEFLSPANSRPDSAMSTGTHRPQSSSSTATGGASSRPGTSIKLPLKFALMVSATPYDTQERGKYSLAMARAQSVSTTFSCPSIAPFEWTWVLPVDTLGQHVRLQIDNAIGMLSLVQVHVIGTSTEEFSGPRVHDVACSDGMTIAIVRAESDEDVLRERFQRAIRADPANRWILAQLETFHPFLLEPRATRASSCVLCRPKEQCVVCMLEDAIFADDKKKWLAQKKQQRDEQEKQRQLQRALVKKRANADANRRGQHRRPPIKPDKHIQGDQEDNLDDHAQEDPIERLRETLTLEEKCQRLLTLAMRTQEEEELAQQRLDAELDALDPMAAQQRAKTKTRHRPQTHIADTAMPSTSSVVNVTSTEPSRARRSIFQSFLSLIGAKAKSTRDQQTPTAVPSTG